jgi:hypothetical protein
MRVLFSDWYMYYVEYTDVSEQPAVSNIRDVKETEGGKLYGPCGRDLRESSW